VKKDKRTYTVLKNSALPTEQQKEKMLAHVLSEYRKIETPPDDKLYRLIAVYPWRFAFGIAAVQTVICSLIWGTGYTNLVLKILGGQ